MSHDREFLNNVVTSTLVLEGEGQVKEYAGGYDDWLLQHRPEPVLAAESIPKPKPPRPVQPRLRRLTYKEQKELEALPERIEALESRLGEIHQQMADPAFFRRPAADIVQAKTNLQDLEKDSPSPTGDGKRLEALRD